MRQEITYSDHIAPTMYDFLHLKIKDTGYQAWDSNIYFTCKYQDKRIHD